MLRTLTSASVGVLATLTGVAAPPSTDPDAEGASFERQLAEWSFGTFLTVELDADPDVFTCTEPESASADETLTCFGLIDGERVVIATTITSGSTGIFDFDVVADYGIVDPAGQPPADIGVTATTSGEAPGIADTVPVTYSDDERNDANVAILMFGEDLTDSAASEMAAIVEATEGAVIAVNAWTWDPTSATFTVDVTLDPSTSVTPDEAAWLVVTELSAHWQSDQPFSAPAATIEPGLVIVVSGQGYASNRDLTAQVADGAITQEDWLAAARQS